MPATKNAPIVVATLLFAAVVVADSPRQPKPILLLTGWVQAAGELRIYPRREDLGHLYDGSCVSGVLTKRRTLPPALQNQRVAAYGTWMSDAELRTMTLGGVSIGVENYCASSNIALVEKLVPISSHK